VEDDRQSKRRQITAYNARFHVGVICKIVSTNRTYDQEHDLVKATKVMTEMVQPKAKWLTLLESRKNYTLPEGVSLARSTTKGISAPPQGWLKL